ncbi:hypothetical protein [Salipiger mangrovisoli]|uniref:Outer membrane protein beta-barrel domain-containing protein n=1 Tax=Salipiger mangrovisoli TaxID=2865933 RepID=A0ABR9X3P8_9RHOB|nr:hypothetical protein [Salipiger mangrovisoli]MBE9638194.1 hypothetical protein [Salipiger mangrovisoli]
MTPAAVYGGLLTALAVMGPALPSHAQSDWDVRITPYMWATGFEGDLGTIPGFPAQSLDLSFGDIWDELNYGLFLFGSARNGPWVIYFDGSVVQTDSTEKIGGPDIDKVNIKSDTSTLTLAFGRTVSQSSRHTLDVFGGIRYWHLENSYSVYTPFGRQKRDTDTDWTDPIVGISGRYALNDRWQAFGAADVGGFGVGSEFQGSLTAGLGYSMSDAFSLALGWRLLDVNYDTDGIVYDARQTGPIIGVTFKY